MSLLSSPLAQYVKFEIGASPEFYATSTLKKKKDKGVKLEQ
jgi:hypothetical protein